MTVSLLALISILAVLVVFGAVLTTRYGNTPSPPDSGPTWDEMERASAGKATEDSDA